MSNGSISSDAPCARLCLIIKREDFDGYGFNLHAEKGKPGQYIGKVDENSPAEAAGLKSGDRIVEVNGVNISNENHKQVVQRIKAVANETRLLVVDAEAEEYYKSKSIVIKSSLPNVKHLKSEHSRNSTDADKHDIEDAHSQKSNRSLVSAENEMNTEKTSGKESNATTPSSDRKHSLASSPEPRQTELRAQLAARKKYDPRKENIDLRHKFDIIQTL
ncbi:hypothetical protein B566_EDAN005062 [Ephemera danica]|nr:hypothetical protein B566_EDAN005062 [Ephemera danica]